VVRHLVAGALGETPPKPLQPRSLAQSILWDGKDDLGQPVDRSRGPFRVRVALGLKARFRRFVGNNPAAVNGINMYPMMYGSIVKFGPEGGEIREGGGGARCNMAFGRSIDVRGAKWITPGASVVTGYSAPKKTLGTFISCVCETHCMDVDEFGRTFFPDAARARVGVLDTAGNATASFGTYGNPDSQGSGGAIPLWWPQAVAVGDREAYVGDRLNRRIVVVRLTYAVERTCEVK